MLSIFLRCVLPLLTGSAALQGVPAPENASDDIALPDVDAMMSEASETVAKLTKTAERMEQVMNITQSQHLVALDRMRKNYTTQLAEQDKANDRIVSQNNVLKRAIDSLNVGNQQIRKSAVVLQETNKGMRTMFSAFKSKFRAADTFLEASLNSSEVPLHAKELQALQEPIPPPTLEKFLKAVRDDAITDNRHTLGLMQVHGKSDPVRRQALEKTGHGGGPSKEVAEEIVTDLNSQITKIGQAHEEGDNMLTANFLAHFEARRLKGDQLLAEQVVLNETKAKALQEQHRLYDAKKAIQRVNDDLIVRMHGISTFAQSASKFVEERIAFAKNVTKNPKAPNSG